MLGYWPYATHKKTFFCFFQTHTHIYIFATFRGKTGYFNTRFVFPQIKKNTNHKLNTRENQRYYSFVFGAGSSRVTDPNQWPGWALLQICMRELLTHALHSAKVINLPSHSAQILYVNAKTEQGKKDLPGEAAAGGEVEEDDWLLLTKDVPARCSRWSQVCRLSSLLVSDMVADETGNGDPLAGWYFSSVSRVAEREGWLLLILLLRLRKGVASAGSITAAEEGNGCGGGHSWASGSARFWLLCWQRGKACKWCSRWLQAGGMRSGEGRREDCVQRESFSWGRGEEQWRLLWRGRAAPATPWLGEKTVTLCSVEEGRSCVWGLRGRRNQRGKGWNRGEGSVGAVVGCLWGVQWLRWRKWRGSRWWLA